MNVLIRLCFIFLIGFFSYNKTLNATTIPSLDSIVSHIQITASLSEALSNGFKWFERHPQIPRIGAYQFNKWHHKNYDSNDTDYTLTIVIIVCVVAIILIIVFIRNILLHLIFMASLIGFSLMYMVGFYYLYDYPFFDYMSDCYESFSACYPHSLELIPALMRYSLVHPAIKLLTYFNIAITPSIIMSLAWVCIAFYFWLLLSLLNEIIFNYCDRILKKYSHFFLGSIHRLLGGFGIATFLSILCCYALLVMEYQLAYGHTKQED
ncbi:hypothetical protein [Helicobacter cetorum]|uniref:hypothetical protein n=1 Tax=Helicobacter cetorum TaxID=138563 RepID=UPI0018F7FF46|nr:hypothetical protein [Helicobacter cetorum]